jgi:hypothetical protein
MIRPKPPRVHLGPAKSDSHSLVFDEMVHTNKLRHLEGMGEGYVRFLTGV